MTLELLIKGSSENFLLRQLIKKNFTSKYKDSVLGILWSFLKPLIEMAILTDFFNVGTKSAMTSIKSNRSILQKIYVPRYIFALGNICSEFLNFLMTMIVMIAIMIATKAPFYAMSIFAIIPIATLFILITGVGLILAIVCTKFSDIEYLYKIFTGLLTYACAIFYPIDIVPQPVRGYMELNPIYGIIAQFREFVMFGRFPSTRIMLTTFAFSIIIFIIGVLIFRKYQDKITLEL